LNKLFSLVRTTVTHRPQAVESLKHFPARVQGVQFGLEAVFPPQSGADAGDGSVRTDDALLAYFDAHKDGAGIWKWRHYFDIYQRHFSKFVGREVHVVEVGIYSGGSLPMWRSYFGEGCRVYGVDIEDACMAYRDERTEVFIGDQSDRSFWARFRQAVPTVDILIDDGGHESEQQRITLEEMLPHLQPGGVYLCEDIHGANNQFAAYLQGLASRLHSFDRCEMPAGVSGFASTASTFQAAVQGIFLYPFVAVIERRDEGISKFVAPKHGTQWQPFL